MNDLGTLHPGPQTYVKASPLSIARRYLGTHEMDGDKHHPQIVAWLQMVAPWANTDEIPWCSAFAYFCAWVLELQVPGVTTCPVTGERSTPAAARSWLTVGTPVELADARPGFDVVVMSRGASRLPGPEVLAAPGHVGLFAAWMIGKPGQGDEAIVLGGNQGNAVSMERFSDTRILGIRRLHGAL